MDATQTFRIWSDALGGYNSRVFFTTEAASSYAEAQRDYAHFRRICNEAGDDLAFVLPRNYWLDGVGPLLTVATK